jgi:phosphoadenosine phosphosulfate reductase
MSRDLFESVAATLDGASPYETLHYALRTFGDSVRIACSLGVEDMVVLHETARAAKALDLTPRVFLLDTGRLHQETHDLLDRARRTYDLALEIYVPEALAIESLVRKKGPNSFYTSIENRQECCAVRKLGPLARALEGARAWVTGLRREQAQSRADVRAVELDETNGGILKLNPLAHFTHDDVWSFVREQRVPTHALHAQGFPSIGCAPCTRPVQPGEDLRGGRWWWEQEEHRECGLHPRRAS